MTSLERMSGALSAPARRCLIGGIRVYRATLSGWLGGQCRFYPTCSHYAEDAIQTHGAIKGSCLAAWRVLRCNPYGAGGVEHVPAHRDARTAPPLSMGTIASYSSPADVPRQMEA